MALVFVLAFGMKLHGNEILRCCDCDEDVDLTGVPFLSSLLLLGSSMN